jgi:hypothetical protein
MEQYYNNDISSTDRVIIKNQIHLNEIYDKFISVEEYIKQLNNNNKSLTSINLYYCRPNNNRMKNLIEAITNNKTLKVLNIGGCNLSDDNINNICKMIETNDTLIHVNLGYNVINGDMLVKLSNSLSKNTSLKILILKYCCFRYNEALSLINGLNNKTLHYIDLSKNFVYGEERDILKIKLNDIGYSN